MIKRETWSVKRCGESLCSVGRVCAVWECGDEVCGEDV